MRHVVASIGAEVATWPEVTTRPMFGIRAVYRKGIVFAMLPEKRSLEVADSIAYKDSAWKFVVIEAGDTRDAMKALRKAYRGITVRRSSDNP